ncbi:hypothetical protein GCM10010324_63480 [Streptomyces hiroshimensis]|uniref:Uncharacterized protein n=1 Tax=Streptomyces hiroshimensis TaxID=66424 RepID=A0ABQ2ZC72_9ACTN|nr:hypothetical protein GCM10010324_63480 [Streptomyces hiroshimensis]
MVRISPLHLPAAGRGPPRVPLSCGAVALQDEAPVGQCVQVPDLQALIVQGLFPYRTQTEALTTSRTAARNSSVCGCVGWAGRAR